MGKNRLRVESLERIDYQDFTELIEDGEDQSSQISTAIVTDPAKSQSWIIDGFEITCPTGKQVQVARGRAILAWRDEGIIKYGAFTTEGDATKTVNIAAYTPGTYGVYVRFEYVDGTTQSRIFWNSAGDGSEYTQTIATRQLANWSIRVESSSPGAEWLKIGEVDQATLAFPDTGITDQHPMFFEGEVHNTYQSGWGSAALGGTANDRDPDRQLYGVKDLQTFTAAMRQGLEDIKGRGLKRWWDPDIGGMNIGFNDDPVSGQLAIGAATNNFELVGTDPTWNFDSGDSLRFDESENELIFQASSADRVKLGTTGIHPVGTSRTVGTDADRWYIMYANTLNLKSSSGIANLYLWTATTLPDEGRWRTYADADGVLQILALEDDGTSGDSVFKAYRLGAAIEKLEVGPSDDRVSIGGVHSGAASTIEMGTTIALNPSGSGDIGKSGKYWDNGYITNGHLTTVHTDSIVAESTNTEIAAAIITLDASSSIALESAGTVTTDADLTPLSAEGASLGTNALPWSGLHSLALTLIDADGTANEKTQLLKSATSEFLISGVTDGATERAHMTFQKDSAAHLESIIFGATGAPEYNLRPHVNEGGNLGTGTYRWDTVFSKIVSTNICAVVDTGTGFPFVEWNDEDATNDLGIYRMYGFQDTFELVSYQYSNLSNNYTPMKFEASPGAANDYETKNIIFKCTDHFQLSDGGLAISSASGGAAGLANHVTFTGHSDSYYDGTGSFLIRSVTGSTSANSTGFIRIKVGTATKHIPYFDIAS